MITSKFPTIGGSLASTLHGFARTTLDSDLVADIRPEHVPFLVQQLGDRYYISDVSMLEWYRLGGEVSDRQWRDILGVIQIQGDRLDLHYLRQGAAGLGVADLLQRALTGTDATAPQSPQIPLDL